MERKKTDSEIEQWVLRELRSGEKPGSPEICVQSHDGVVTLNGSVPNDANKSDAEQAACRVVGIVGLVNDIRVKPCSALIRKSSMTVALPDRIRPSALLPATLVEQPVAKAAAAP